VTYCRCALTGDFCVTYLDVNARLKLQLKIDNRYNECVGS